MFKFKTIWGGSKVNHQERGLSLFNEAEQKEASGDDSGALESYTECLEHLEKVAKKDSSNTVVRDKLKLAYRCSGEVAQRLKNYDLARQHYEAAINLKDPKATALLRDMLSKISPVDQANLPPPVAKQPAMISPVSISNTVMNTFMGSTSSSTVSITAYPIIFLQNPPSQSTVASVFVNTSGIRDTRELAYFFNQSVGNKEELKKLVLDVIETFSKHSVKTEMHVREIVALAIIEDEDITRELFEKMIQGEHELPNRHMLNGLAEVIDNVNPQWINPNHLVRILTVIQAQLGALHAQGNEKEIKSFLLVISRVLISMADINVRGLDRVALHEPLYDMLTGFMSDASPTHQQIAGYARQALLRVPNNESKLKEFIRRSMNIASGLNSLKSVLTNKDPSELLNVYHSFKKAFKLQMNQEPWYDDLRYVALLIDCNQFVGFEFIVKNTFSYQKKEIVLGLVRLVSDALNTHPEIRLRSSLLDFLNQMWTNPFYGEHESVQRWITEIFYDYAVHPNKMLREKAQSCLEQFKVDPNNAKWMTLFNSMVDVRYLDRLPQQETPNIFPTELLNEVFHPHAQPTSGVVRTIMAKIEAIRQSRLTDEMISQELTTYIPVNGCHGLTVNNKSFDLKDEMLSFLKSAEEPANDKKVLLLTGCAGSGKSTVNLYLERSLWVNYHEGAPIPLFIPLPGISDLQNIRANLMNEHLEKMLGFSHDEIVILKANYRFILILDGYDEKVPIEHPFNVYPDNHLAGWNAKTIISCRDTYLRKLGPNYKLYFAPYVNGAIKITLLMEAVITPFSESQITSYIVKYIAVNAPMDMLLWRDPKKYEENIIKIPGLKELIKTPFLLKVTMDVMPMVIGWEEEQQFSNERILMNQKILLDYFVESLFDREILKLAARNQLPAGLDVKENFKSFAMELAVAMFEADVTEVTYVPSSTLFGSKKDNSPWKKFFGTPDDKEQAIALAQARLGCGAILRTTKMNSFSFIHAILLDYFYTKRMEDEMGFEAEEAIDFSGGDNLNTYRDDRAGMLTFPAATQSSSVTSQVTHRK